MIFLKKTLVTIATAGALVALAFTHFHAYQHGKAVTQARWDAETLRLTEVAMKAEREQREKEQALQTERQKVEVEYEQIKKKAAADAALAQSELDRLRDALASRDRAARQNPTASCGAHAGAGPERELLGSCATSLVGMAQEADRLTGMVSGLQAYVKNVCLAP